MKPVAAFFFCVASSLLLFIAACTQQPQVLSSPDIPARSKQAIPDLMDLASYYNSTLKDGNLASLPLGVHAYHRAAFDIRGMIRLAGASSSDYPDSVTGIAINHKGEKIDFLQGAAGRATEDTLVGNYFLHYANGETKSIPLIYGRNIKDFRGTDEPVLTGAFSVAVYGERPVGLVVAPRHRSPSY